MKRLYILSLIIISTYILLENFTSLLPQNIMIKKMIAILIIIFSIIIIIISVKKEK